MRNKIMSVLLIILPFLYNNILHFVGNTESNLAKIILCLCFAIFFVAHLIVICKKEQLKTKMISECSKDRLFQKIGYLLVESSNHLYKKIKQGSNQHIEIKDWGFINNNCNTICEALYQLITDVAEVGESFSVSIIFKEEKDSQYGYTMPSFKAPAGFAEPRLFQTFQPRNEVEKYYYSKFLENSSTSVKVLESRKAIEKEFEIINEDYSQYIAIPIYCTGGKKFAMLQIVAYGDSIICKKHNDLKDLTNKYFLTFANLVVLLKKTENAIQMINEEFSLKSDSIPKRIGKKVSKRFQNEMDFLKRKSNKKDAEKMDSREKIHI